MGSTSQAERENVKGEVHELRVAALDATQWGRNVVSLLNECERDGATPQRIQRLAECGRQLRQIGEQIANSVQIVACLPSAIEPSKRAERNGSLPDPLRDAVNAIGGAPMFRDNVITTNAPGGVE